MDSPATPDATMKPCNPARRPFLGRLAGVLLAATFALKSSGITKPADMAGKRMGAPVFDAGRKTWPLFAKANQMDPGKANWTNVDPALRETLLVKGDLDVITGFYYTSVLNLEARG